MTTTSIAVTMYYVQRLALAETTRNCISHLDLWAQARRYSQNNFNSIRLRYSKCLETQRNIWCVAVLPHAGINFELLLVYQNGTGCMPNGLVDSVASYRRSYPTGNRAAEAG